MTLDAVMKELESLADEKMRTHHLKYGANENLFGAYRDYRVSKGCVSPFAPIWINELVSRQS